MPAWAVVLVVPLMRVPPRLRYRPRYWHLRRTGFIHRYDYVVALLDYNFIHAALRDVAR